MGHTAARQGIDRRLAAILSANVAGYSRLMSKDEAGMLAALKANHTEFVYREIANHGGCIVNLMGDGALVHRHRQIIHPMPMQRIDLARMISHRHARSE